MHAAYVRNTLLLARQVVALAEYRAQLFDYLRSRMSAIAPNLTVGLLGEHLWHLPAPASSVERMLGLLLQLQQAVLNACPLLHALYTCCAQMSCTAQLPALQPACSPAHSSLRTCGRTNSDCAGACLLPSL